MNGLPGLLPLRGRARPCLPSRLPAAMPGHASSVKSRIFLHLATRKSRERKSSLSEDLFRDWQLGWMDVRSAASSVNSSFPSSVTHTHSATGAAAARSKPAPPALGSVGRSHCLVRLIGESDLGSGGGGGSQTLLAPIARRRQSPVVTTSNPETPSGKCWHEFAVASPISAMDSLKLR